MSAGFDPPLPGNVLQTVVELGPEYGMSGRYDTADPAEAQVTTSMVGKPCTIGVPQKTGTHRPVLDIDIPAKLIPSSTPGHSHLYLDVEVEHHNYMLLLDALALCGVIEKGYAEASKERGYTAVRLPWVKKEPATASAAGEPF